MASERSVVAHKNQQLDLLLAEWDTLGRASDQSPDRPNVVALATAVGLVAFLVAEALPGPLSGVAAFVIAFAGVISLIVLAAVLAAITEQRQRRVYREELIRVLETALRLARQGERSEHWSASSELAVSQPHEIDQLLARLREELE